MPGRFAPSRRSARWNGWLVAMIGMLVLPLLVTGLITMVERGPRPPFLASDFHPRHDAVHHHGAELLHLAGSGSNLPLTRALAEEFSRWHGGRIVVRESIGSTGAVRAAFEGAIELGLVSRPLRPEEKALGLQSFPYARTPVTIAANASVPDDGVTAGDLVALVRGHRTTWSDGSAVVVLQREQGDSSNLVVDEAVPGFAAANEQAYQDGRWRVLHHDAAMREALVATPGAVGLYAQGRVPSHLSIKALTVDGVAPTVEAVQAGRYPFYKDFAFIARGKPEGLAAEFLAYARSPEARALMRRLGYVPLPQEDR